MEGKQRKQYTCTTKAVDVQNRTIEMIGSTQDYDRSGDKMYMVGVDLTNYKKNPIILPNHDYSATAIGKCLDVHVEGTTLIFKIQFAETDAGNEWFYLYSNGYMNASSIGFIPLEYKPNDQGGYDFTKWELLELSLVTVPCNQNAIQRMQKALAKGEISEDMFTHLAKMGNFTELKLNPKEDILKMGKEELQKLIDEAIATSVKSLVEKHEGEMKTKTDELETKANEIAKLNEDLAEITKKLEDMEVKAGASHSKATVETINSCCKGIMEHCDKLKALVEKPAEDPKEDPKEEAKDYSDEEIQKMVEANIEKLLAGLNA